MRTASPMRTATALRMSADAKNSSFGDLEPARQLSNPGISIESYHEDSRSRDIINTRNVKSQNDPMDRDVKKATTLSPRFNSSKRTACGNSSKEDILFRPLDSRSGLLIFFLFLSFGFRYLCRKNISYVTLLPYFINMSYLPPSLITPSTINHLKTTSVLAMKVNSSYVKTNCLYKFSSC